MSPTISRAVRSHCGSVDVARKTPATRSWIVPLILCSIGVFGIACCLRFHQLDQVSFWFDEACSWRISQFPSGELLDAVARDAHPPLFYLLQKLWMKWCGTSILSARLLSTLLGLGVVTAAAWFGHVAVQENMPVSSHRASAWQKLASPLLCAILVSVSPLQIEFSQTARSYVLGVLLSIVSGTSLLLALKQPHQLARWIGFALSITALSMTHYFGLLTVAALFLSGGLETVRKPRSRERMAPQLGGLLLSAGLFQLSWWPWAATFFSQLSRVNTQLWLKPLVPADALQVIGETLSGGRLGTADVLESFWLWGAAAVWIVVPLACWRFCGRAGRQVSAVIVIPVVLALLYSIAVRNVFDVRYLVFSQTFLLLGLGLLGGRIRPVALSLTFSLLLVGMMAWGCREYATTRNFLASRSGIRHAVEFLDRQRHPDEPLLISTPFVYVSVLESLKNSDSVYVQYSADHRQDLLAGPPLRESDYASIAGVMESLPPVIWTIDVEDLFGASQSVSIPDAYRPVGQRRFAEACGISMQLIVRTYALNTPARKTKRLSTQQ